jgi:hypothetical protein
LLVALLITVPVFGAERGRIDLTGTWDFYPDVGDAALPSISATPRSIQVPGAWQAQGYGEPGGTIPSSVVGSDISRADYLRHNLLARCLYVREVEIPAAWQGQRVFLCVRRVYRYADVTVNGTRVGEHEGFCSPFEVEVTKALRFDGRNRLVLGVDNRPRPGRDTVGTANYFGNWGGVGGGVCLEARPTTWIGDVFAMPRVAAAQVNLRIRINASQPAAAEKLEVAAEVAPASGAGQPNEPAGRASASVELANSLEITVDIPVNIAGAHFWSPEDPFLYRARVRLRRNGQTLDELAVRFGLREVTAQGRKLFLNGKPLYLSGYGDDATEPLTGMLPADKNQYRRRLQLMRSLGFNFVRHHSCVPHDEYFEAADEVGMFVQPEAGMAYVKYWPKAHPLFVKEWPRIITAFRNHPCILDWCMGNELFLNDLPNRDTNAPAYAATSPGGTGLSRQEALRIVGVAYQQAKELDPTRLVHASDGGTPQEFSDIFSAGGAERFGPRPFLLHEYGTYCCSLPDFSLIPRLTGVIRPMTYERAEKYVRERGYGAVYPKLRRSSLLMRAEAQKFYMEAARASGSNAGYSFWLGIDFPDSPEGCWDEGILNQLWEPKPYLTNNLTDYNGKTVLLINAGMDARSLYADDAKTVGLRLWHYGAEPIQQARLQWRLTEGELVLKRGEIEGIACELGESRPLGVISIDGVAGSNPRFLTLEAELRGRAGRLARNEWPFYAYPRMGYSEPLAGVYSEAGRIPGAVELNSGEPIPASARVLVAKALKKDRHAAYLRAGRRALLLLGNGGFKETRAGFFLNQHGAAFGGAIEAHPVFDGIPHEGRFHPGLYQLIAGGGLLEAESMPAWLRQSAVVWGLRLTGWISPVKDLNQGAHWCEVMADNQTHFVLCSLDLLADKPESRYVLAKTLEYLVSGKAPEKTCTVDALETLLR